jgi:hypothetical protein
MWGLADQNIPILSTPEREREGEGQRKRRKERGMKE